MSDDPGRPPRYLRTEYQVDPLGLDETEPRFSWLLDDDRRGARQSAYQVHVASSARRLADGEADLWDSGQVRSDETVHIVYRGAPLTAFTRAVWRVRVWDGAGRESAWSEPARFELGPLTILDWSGAAFVRTPIAGGLHAAAPAPYLRRAFVLEDEPARARLYLTALGLYDATINGLPVTDAVFRPGWTDYGRRVPYQAYDVTALLTAGPNVIGAILGDGWYCGRVERRRQQWGDRPQLLAKLVVESAAGGWVTIATDGEWQYAEGPILASDIYDGETYDARRAMPGWDRPGGDRSGWTNVEVVADAFDFRAELVATVAPPVRRVLEIAPVSCELVSPGVYRIDLGQNIAGRVRVRASAPEGTELTLCHAEAVDDDGSLYTGNLQSARATDRYIFRGDGVEVYEPRFTYHGFRFVEVSGLLAAPVAGTVTGIVLQSDTPDSGAFACSNDLVNRLQQNIRSSQRANFFEVPTDCPQRSERLGWTGDIQVFATTAAFNMEVAAFLGKYVVDLRDGQLGGGGDRGAYPCYVPSIARQAGGPGWADAGVIVPWVLFQRYGDTRVLERHYPSMLAYVDYLDRVERGTAGGAWPGFGDWLSLDDPDRSTPHEFIRMAFAAYTLDLMTKVAAVLGKEADGLQFLLRRGAVEGQLVDRYVDGGGRLRVQTQTALALALRFGLLGDPEHRRRAADDLVANVERVGQLRTGFLGTPHLLPVLHAVGRSDLAFRLLERTEYPSWLYPVTLGATTIWERWDARTAAGYRADEMNSLNHYAYGAVGEFLFRVIAGIDTVGGYRHVVVAPELGGSLTSAEARVDSIRGRISSAWSFDDGGAIVRVTLPPNTTGTLRLPARDPDDVREGGSRLEEADGLSSVGVRSDRVEVHALAGSYDFSVRHPIVSNGPPAQTRPDTPTARRSDGR